MSMTGLQNRDSWRRGLLAGVCAAILAAGPAPLLAQTNGDEQDGSVVEFREHVAQGAKLRKAGEFRQALERFQKARQIADHPKLGYAVGRLHEKIGDCAAAKAEFEKGLDDPRTSSKLETRLKEAISTNAECVDRGELVVECRPADAEVTLTVGEETRACPASFELTAGQHTLRASAPELATRTVEVTVEPAGQHRQQIELGEPWQRTAVTYTKYGALGLGGVLFVGGIISDASAGSRQGELAQASSDGDVQRANRLAEEADSAQTRTIALYSVGTLLLAGGAALWFYDSEAEALLMGDNKGPSAHINVTADGASVGATFRW